MNDPVPSGIRGEGKVSCGISVDFVVEVEQDAEASVCKDGMCGFGENVIIRKAFFSRRESLRCQVLLDGEVRKLYELVAALIDDGDETRACGYHRLFCVLWTPGGIKGGGVRCHLVALDCEDLRKFMDAKRANGYSETLKEPLSKFSFLLIDIQQCTVICFVQCLRQVIQNLPNTDRKSAT